MAHIALRRFLDNTSSVHVLVVGDVMLDAYVSGSASRISPEAPVPIVGVSRRLYVPGGAANVAANILALGARVSLAGVTGVDESAVRLRRELDRTGAKHSGANMDALVEDTTRPTTTKTRITAHGQQIVRFDEEDTSPLSESTEALLRTRCTELLPGVDAIVISDYAKGVISDTFCRWLIGETLKRQKPVVVDPKSRDLTRYRGATVVTPNLKEAAGAAGEPAVETSGDLARAVKLLLPQIAPSALLVTRGEDGMSLFEQDQTARHIPALRNEVADVTGAGDTVVGVLAIALGLRFALADAAILANIAAGVAVAHPGTWAVRPEELAEAAARLDLTSPLPAAVR
ncbi:MAG TPA: PfkB family carbohydrate kinase [Bryobacteraceae bacterium]|jgi:D-beta-D-heptose 7-phosphate kinase/D-beta-D-heptose 1-phosphate adenosyltransferase